MENTENIILTPAALARLLKTEFPEISEVEGLEDSFDYRIEIDYPGNAASLVKSMDAYLKDLILRHGDVAETYYFQIQREREILDKLVYNDPDHCIRLEIPMDGVDRQLRIINLVHADEFAVYDEDFNLIGDLHNEEGSRFFDPKINWKTSIPSFEPFVELIVLTLRDNFEEESGEVTISVDVNDPDDLSFWTAQFAISDVELKAAIDVVGPDVDALTAYLQK